MNNEQTDEPFSGIRPRLIRLAYRMLGSVTDAEDVVQDAYLRWLASDREVVRQPAALLYTIVVRLCLNELKTARRKRETYIGPWLPEPIFDVEPDLIEDITLPLMLALERLSPLERAVFLLHDVFGMGFDDVARTIGREPATCRKLVSRAREHIRAARPRYLVTEEHGLEIAAAFFSASRSGNMDKLQSLLTDDVIASTDGGGRVPASLRPLVGISEVMARHIQLIEIFNESPSHLIGYVIIDGLPGFITVEDGGIMQTTALKVEEEGITAIYIIRNPDKLRHIDGAEILP